MSEFNIEESFIQLLKDTQRNLRERYKNVNTEFNCLSIDITYYNYLVNQIEKTNGKIKDLYLFPIDKENPLEKLKKLEVIHNGIKVPLFSESFLYDTLGKEQARDVLYLFNQVLTSNGKLPL